MSNDRYKTIVYILLFSVLLYIPCFGQKKKEPERNDKIFSLGAQILGPTMIAGYVEFAILSRFFITGALGIYSDYQVGINFSIVNKTKRQRWYPYLGVHFASVTNEAFDPGEKDRVTSFYFPLGLRFESKSDFIVCFEMGYNVIEQEFSQLNTQRFLGTVRLGVYL